METENKRHPHLKLFGLIAAIVALLVTLWSWGLSILSNLDTFWKIFDPDREVFVSQNKHNTPPPYLNPLEPATKEKRITVSGYSTEGMLVRLFLNNTEFGSARADKEGAFLFSDIELNEGDNSLYVKADAGNESESTPSKTVSVKFLKKAPKLEIIEPADRAVFSQKANTITIRGHTDPTAIVMINRQKALVTSDGTFTYLFPLNDGENKLVIESSDEAGNKTTIEKLVTFSRTF